MLCIPDRFVAAGFIVSPVEQKKSLQTSETNASLRDASNTVDAQSPRVSAQRPTAKEIAAARAARIRLGYETDDTGSMPEACSYLHACRDHC